MAFVGALGLPVGVARAQAPVNQTPPTIITNPPNLAIVGATVEDGGAAWTAPVTGLTYQWLDCDAGGGTCVAIPGATASSYRVGPSDLMHTLRVVETASNGTDSASAMSAFIRVAEVPENTSSPVITGKTEVGHTLGVTTGTWSGDGTPMTFAYQWERCGAGLCNIPIAGATHASYTVTSADLSGLSVLVTATSDGGQLSSGVYAMPVAIKVPVVIAPTPMFPGQIENDPIHLTGAQAMVPYLLAHNGYSAPVVVDQVGRLEITWTTTQQRKHVKVASGQASYHTRGNHRFRLALTSKGRKLLRTSKRLKLTLDAWYVTRNPENLQWGSCVAKGSINPQRRLVVTHCAPTFLGRPPKLSL